VIEIDHARKNAIVAGMKRVFELADFPGLFPHQPAHNGMSIAERSHAEKPDTLSREHRDVPPDKSVASGVHDPS
jgi:hypothetical protein